MSILYPIKIIQISDDRTTTTTPRRPSSVLSLPSSNGFSNLTISSDTIFDLKNTNNGKASDINNNDSNRLFKKISPSSSFTTNESSSPTSYGCNSDTASKNNYNNGMECNYSLSSLDTLGDNHNDKAANVIRRPTSTNTVTTTTSSSTNSSVASAAVVPVNDDSYSFYSPGNYYDNNTNYSSSARGHRYHKERTRHRHRRGRKHDRSSYHSSYSTHPSVSSGSNNSNKNKPKFVDLPLEWWERSEGCRDAKSLHMDRVDNVCYSREELVLLTTLWRDEVVLEPNMFPYDTPHGVEHYTLWSLYDLSHKEIVRYVDAWLSRRYPQVCRWQYDDNNGERSIELFHVHVFIEMVPFSFHAKPELLYLPPHLTGGSDNNCISNSNGPSNVEEGKHDDAREEYKNNSDS
jgi:hypothetical protein